MNATSHQPERAAPALTLQHLESTPWAKAFAADSPVSYKQALAYALQPGLRVFLSHTDENGEMQWAICVEEDPLFWMDAFDTRAEAVALCKTMKWKMVRA
jgi:hypothetical protein